MSDYTVVNFLQDVRRFHNYDQVVFARNRNITAFAAFRTGDLGSRNQAKRVSNNFRLDVDYETQFVQNLMTDLVVPVILFNELTTFGLRQHFSDALMVVVYLEDTLESQTGLLNALVASLDYRRQSKVLFLINNKDTTATCDDTFLQQLFQFCWQSKMINVAALCSDYKLTAQFYSYTHFPVFALEYKTLNADLFLHGPIYPYRLGNLHGYKLPYIIGGSEPRIIVYNYNGQRIVGGSAGNFFKNFARKHNFSLYEPQPTSSYTEFTSSRDLIAAVRNSTVEISAAPTFTFSPAQLSTDGFTYPYEQTNWCAWVPIEPDIPNSEFFWIVFDELVFILMMVTLVVISSVLSGALWRHGNKPDILHFFLHGACFRGVLGQSVREICGAPFVIRFIYLQIYFFGILLTTSYNSHFGSYWTRAPKERSLNTFDDILHSNWKVYILMQDFNEIISQEELRKYIPMFQIETDYQTFLNTRDAFDMKYIYMIPTTKWKIFKEQQKFFTTPLFRMRLDLCLFRNIPLCFPINNNSIFTEIANEMILDAAQSGLTEHWTRSAFLELINAGRLSFMDLSRKNEFRAMKVEDLNCDSGSHFSRTPSEPVALQQQRTTP
ncbi:uncharacterized protein LOC129253328 [Anastrepha obliqua]|uniref:uncharacterized protein LOC129253328 n=1 Tax=Anastrepha obliqua TaxID=95512 RepID=UPI002409FED4|nr:uncharacterized protein LOC129253328 [Anastrepha obliqua]